MIKPQLVLICSALTLLISCGKELDQQTTIPQGILNKDQFSQVLCDFALAESAANINIKSVAYNKIDSVYAFNPLIENNIRKSQYDSTIQFYTKHPELFKEVYALVLERLSEQLAERTAVKKDSSSK